MCVARNLIAAVLAPAITVSACGGAGDLDRDELIIFQVDSADAGRGTPSGGTGLRSEPPAERGDDNPPKSETTTTPFGDPPYDRVCQSDDQAGCCHAGENDRPPNCAWRRLRDGMTFQISRGYLGSDRTNLVTLPKPIRFTALIPTQLVSQDDCGSHTFGLVMQATGLNERSADVATETYAVQSTETWDYNADFGRNGALAVHRATADSASAPVPTFKPSRHCSDLFSENADPTKPSTESFVWRISEFFDIELAGQTYVIALKPTPGLDGHPVTSYYIQLDKRP